MGEIKPVVTEKHEFQYRDESIIVALFVTFGLSRIDSGNNPENYSMELFATRWKLSIRTLGKEIKPVAIE